MIEFAHGVSPADSSVPQIDVNYAIGSTEQIYELADNERSYVGLRGTFSLTFSTGHPKDDLSVEISVDPPAQFSLKTLRVFSPGAGVMGVGDQGL